MAKMKKETRIKRRYQELQETYANLPEHKKIIAEPLIRNAAFMEIELEDLAQLIAETGSVEEYKNGENQYGKKQSSSVQAYNQLMKSYNSINARLENMLPPESPKSKLDAFLGD